MRMCSPDFFSQHKYKYVERPIDFELEESFEESGNPPESPAYDEPDRDHSQHCVAKGASSNEDLGYACLQNERMPSMCAENDTLNPLYEETTNLSGTENQNRNYARQNANLNETHDYDEVREIAGYHSRLGHNKNGAHIAANGFKYNNNKREGSEHGGCPSLSIVNGKQSGIPMETKYQCLRENKGKEKGETQSYQSETEVQEQEGDEEEFYEPVGPRADPNKNAILKEFNEAMKNALVEDHGAQSPIPTGEGTECEVPHRTSPFRRIRTIWKKQKSPEAKKQRTRKAKNLENKENAVPGCGSETEIVLEQVPEEVNEQDRTEE